MSGELGRPYGEAGGELGRDYGSLGGRPRQDGTESQAGTIACTRCGAERPRFAFDPERLEEWTRTRNLRRDAVCRACEGRGPDATITCTRCGAQRPTDAFDPEKLEEWTRTRNLRRDAVCRACEERETAAIRCTVCTQERDPSAFDRDLLALWRRGRHLAHHATCEECLTASKRIVCVRCGAPKVAADFDAARLASWKRHHNLSHRATCKDCEGKAAADAGGGGSRPRTGESDHTARGGTSGAGVRCTLCGKDLEEKAFSPLALLAWRRSGELATRAACEDCRRRSNTWKVGRDWHFECMECHRELAAPSFDVQELLTLSAAGEMSRLVCVACRARTAPDGAAARRMQRQSDRHFACGRCGEEKPASAFSDIVRKTRYSANRWKCMSCQFPSCRICGRKPEQPCIHPFEDGDYFCSTCAFPPCAGGCGRPRPHNSKNHARKKAEWYCTECRKRDLAPAEPPPTRRRIAGKRPPAQPGV